MAVMVLMPTTRSKSLGETSTTRLTLCLAKKAMASSSTAEVMRVLPSRLPPEETAWISLKVPTMTWDLATALATILFFRVPRTDFRKSPGTMSGISSLPLAKSSS